MIHPAVGASSGGKPKKLLEMRGVI